MGFESPRMIMKPVIDRQQVEISARTKRGSQLRPRDCHHERRADEHAHGASHIDRVIEGARRLSVDGDPHETSSRAAIAGFRRRELRRAAHTVNTLDWVANIERILLINVLTPPHP